MRIPFRPGAALSFALLACAAGALAFAQTGPTYVNDPLVAFEGAVFFGASSAASPEQLWRSDGTGQGTRKIQDFRALNYPPPEGFTVFGSRLYFFVDGGLWRLEDSERPSPVGDLPGHERPLEVATTDSTLFFTFDDGVHGAELWKSDGTSEGTALFADILPGAEASYPNLLTPIGQTLFFFAYDSEGYGLWRTDGSTGPQRVRSLPGPAIGDGLIATNGNQMLFAVTDPSGTDTPSQLWRSDGTAEGTVLVRRFAIEPGGPCPMSCPPVGLAGLTPFGNFFLFFANDGEHGRELWRSDGTAEGTALVADLTPGAQGGYFSGFVEAGGLLYFGAQGANGVTELWTTDGSESGTRLVPGIPHGPIPLQAGGVFPYAGVGSRVLFVSSDLNALYSTDGTAGGVLFLQSLGLEPGATTFGGFATLPDGNLLFTRRDSTATTLWKTDGTPAGTLLVPFGGRPGIVTAEPSVRGTRSVTPR